MVLGLLLSPDQVAMLPLPTELPVTVVAHDPIPLTGLVPVGIMSHSVNVADTTKVFAAQHLEVLQMLKSLYDEYSTFDIVTYKLWFGASP
jgi:hypothetical protein